MKGSVSEHVRTSVARKRSPGFVRASDFDAPAGAVEAELSRLVRAQRLYRVRKGLYWAGPRTALGVAAPDPEVVALEVAGRGAGPAGVEAARWLGLTTQVPGCPTFAVPGRPPVPVRHVTFTSRTVKRRELGLRPLEVAVLEVLRDFPLSVEADWERVVDRIATLIAERKVRPAVVDADVPCEHHAELRKRWAELRSLVDAAS